MNIKYRIFFFMCILIVVSATAFSVILYNTQRKALLDGVNNNLLTAAYAAQNILPDNYHDNIVDEHSVSKAEFDKIVNTNNRLCRKLNLQYIWSVMVIDDQIVFTSSTSPSMDVEKDDHAKFFDVHQDP
ncbi:MAG: hypothetical protein GY702_21205, partial [Desulfobulbaceae bacterium]|nr:hypothetical protein [Desulfobulbaceae bacterium]